MVTIRGYFRLPQLSASPVAAHSPRNRLLRHDRHDITEIIPLDGFGDLDDLDFGPELELKGLESPLLSDDSSAPQLTVAAEADGRLPHSPFPSLLRALRCDGSTSAARGRLLISAMAVGAVVAAMHTTTIHSVAQAKTVPTVNASALTGGAGGTAPRGVQVIAAQPAANIAVHNEELARGVAFAEERAQREARLRQPLYVAPAKGIFTSGFGYRWGVLHAGIDLANTMGTPILAVSDGVVIDAGPTAGYGMWVKLRHADGTVTLYGHVNTTLVSIGQHVMAGDQIATMGNRGNSTGPHLHFEVLLGGTQRIDPVAWLAKREIYVGGYPG